MVGLSSRPVCLSPPPPKCPMAAGSLLSCFYFSKKIQKKMWQCKALFSSSMSGNEFYSFPRQMAKLGHSSFSMTSSSSHHASPYEAYIELEQRIYNPGDVVSGQVFLNLDRPLVCDRIVARLFGSARVFFTEILKEAGPSFGKSRAYQQEKILVDQTEELWASGNENNGQQIMDREKKQKKAGGKSLEEIVRQCNPNAIRIGPRRNDGTELEDFVANNGKKKVARDDEGGLSVGKHQFHFAFKLPLDGLFTSFDARGSAGSIRYYILVRAFNDGFNCLRRKLLFPVVCPLRLDDPQLLGVAMEPVVETGSDKKELLKVQLRLDKRGFVPGEPLVGSVWIKNNSGKSVKRMFLRIVQRTSCFATKPEFGTHQSQFETAGMGLPMPKIRTGQTVTFPIRFYVPALVPAVCVPGCLESEHLLWLDLSNKRGIRVELTTPLLIGTHPTPPRRPSETFVPEAALDEKVIPPVTGPPPVYFEELSTPLLENVPPPSYAQSVTGLSELTETASSAEGVSGGRDQQQQQQQPYSGPLCYHYNFGFNATEGEGDTATTTTEAAAGQNLRGNVVESTADRRI